MQSTKISSKSGWAASETCSMRRASASARRALGLGQQAELGAERGRVADVADALAGQVGDEADAQRAGDRHVVAEAAGQHQLRDVVGGDAGDVLQHRDAGGDRALGELHLAHVVLREDDLARGAGLARAAATIDLALLAAHDHPVAQARRAAGRAPSTWISPVQSITPASSSAGDEVDEAGAADAERVGLADRVQVEVVVDGRRGRWRPRAPRMPWRICAPSSAGPAGAEHAHRRVARAEQHLAVGADVDGDAQLVVSSMRVASATATASAPTKPATSGSRHTRASGATFRNSSRAASVDGVAHHRRVGREADVRGIDAEQQVVHARVADDDDLVDPLRQHARLARDLLDVLVQEADDARVAACGGCPG